MIRNKKYIPSVKTIERNRILKIRYIEMKKTMVQFDAFDILSKDSGLSINTIMNIISNTKI